MLKVKTFCLAALILISPVAKANLYQSGDNQLCRDSAVLAAEVYHWSVMNPVEPDMTHVHDTLEWMLTKLPSGYKYSERYFNGAMAVLIATGKQHPEIINAEVLQQVAMAVINDNCSI
jgi:hypothetical protein